MSSGGNYTVCYLGIAHINDMVTLCPFSVFLFFNGNVCMYYVEKYIYFSIL